MKKLLALIIGTLMIVSGCSGKPLASEGELPSGVSKFQDNSVVCYVLDPWQRSGIAISCVKL